jgi:hypothetical protein
VATLSAASPADFQTFSAAKAATARPLTAPTPSEKGTSSKPKSAEPRRAIISAPWLAAAPSPRIAPGAIMHRLPSQRV